MPGIVLDTSVIIPAERQRWTVPQLLNQFRSIADEGVVALPTVVVAELAHGVYREQSPTRLQDRLTYLSALTRSLPILPFTVEMAMLAGRLNAETSLAGNRIPFADLMIGATALHHNFAILTTNERHFRMIPGLVVIPF